MPTRRLAPLRHLQRELERAEKDLARREELLAKRRKPSHLVGAWITVWRLAVERCRIDLYEMQRDISLHQLDADGRPVARRSRKGSQVQKPLVIVIEPEPFIRLDVAETVSDLGYEVTDLRTAEDAVRFIDQADKPALIITAVSLEGQLDGHGLISRARSRWPKLPAIILTAGDDDPSLRDETTVLVQKPFTTEAIEKSVQGLMRPAPFALGR